MSIDHALIDGLVRRIPDYPKPGICFYDIMPLLADPDGLSACRTGISDWARALNIALVLGVEARGFILGGAIAGDLGAGFVAARKPGKLPWEHVSANYALEYGTDSIEMHRDAVQPGRRVLVHDDLLATGGTADAACRLVEELGGIVVGVGVIIELEGLGGRERLAGREIFPLLKLPA